MSMKKFLLSAFALIFAMTVSADVEIGTGSSFSGEKTEGTQVASTSSVTWSVGADTWSSTGSGSLYINSTSSTSFSKTGTNGSTNPVMSTITKSDGSGTISQGLPTSGSYHKFTVSADGYLYLVGKLSTKKNYIAFEGENRIPYYWAAYDATATGVVSFDLSKQTGLLSKDNNSYIANDSTVQYPKTYIARQGLVQVLTL